MDINSFDTLAALSGIDAPVHLAIGFFDGVHNGHREVIRTALNQSRLDGGQVWVLTFAEHPLSLLRPSEAPATITSNRFKALLFQQLGVSGCIFEPFTPDLASRSPEHFIELLRHHCPSLAGIYVGANWRFGHQGRGDTEMLEMLLKRTGIGTAVSPSVQSGENTISSTLIRTLVRAGDLKPASALLGYPFTITGTVIEGHKLGRELGFPTANIHADHTLLPPNGVYAVTLKCKGATYSGVLNIGIRPTVDAGTRTTLSLEVHIFEMVQNIYDHYILVQPVAFLRKEQRFKDTGELVRQIERDCHQARELLATSEVLKSATTDCN